jgi:hypothetical protein
MTEFVRYPNAKTRKSHLDNIARAGKALDGKFSFEERGICEVRVQEVSS